MRAIWRCIVYAWAATWTAFALGMFAFAAVALFYSFAEFGKHGAADLIFGFAFTATVGVGCLMLSHDAWTHARSLKP